MNEMVKVDLITVLMDDLIVPLDDIETDEEVNKAI